MPIRYVETQGVATHVRHTGPTTLPERPPELGAAPPLVCLHGAGGNLGVFDGLFDALDGERGLVAFDLPAHGRSGALDALPSVEAMADFVADLLGSLAISRAILLGHSMGGAIAQELAQKRPELVAGLVLCCTTGDFSGDAMEATVDATRLIAEGKARRAFTRELYGPDAKPDVMQRGFMEDLKTDPRALLGDLIAIRDWRGGPGSAGLAVPARVVRGEHELPNIAEGSDALLAGLTRARGDVIPGAGHKLPLENPAALADVVRSFLAEVSS